MVESSLLLSGFIWGQGQYSSVLFQTILGISFFSSSFNGSAETLKSGALLRLSCLLVCLSHRGKQTAIAASPTCAVPKLQQPCMVSCKWHVTVNSQCVSSLTGTQRVTASSNTTLGQPPPLRDSTNKTWEQGEQDRHFEGFFSVSSDMQLLWSSSVKCHSCSRCDCEHGAVHKTQMCYLNSVTPEQCPPLNVIALSDK